MPQVVRVAESARTGSTGNEGRWRFDALPSHALGWLCLLVPLQGDGFEGLWQDLGGVG